MDDGAHLQNRVLSSFISAMVVPIALGRHVGFEIARADVIDTNTIVTQVHGQRLGQLFKSTLSGGVRGIRRKS